MMIHHSKAFTNAAVYVYPMYLVEVPVSVTVVPGAGASLQVSYSMNMGRTYINMPAGVVTVETTENIPYGRIPTHIKVTQTVAATESFMTINSRAASQDDSTPATPSATNYGTAGGSYVVATEYGDGVSHSTSLQLQASAVLPAIAGGANLAVGKLMYTFPAGEIIVDSASFDFDITQTEAHITADTPDVGLGTVIASGNVALLSGTGTFEDIITGQTATNCNGANTVKAAIPTAGVPLVIATADPHTVYLNVADGWAAGGDAAALLTGKVVLNWRFMS